MKLKKIPNNGKKLFSKIKLKLARWNAGNNDSTPFCFGKIMHPEVRQGMIESSLYLGYGPVSINGVKQHIPENAVNKLILLFPEKYENELIETIKLINYFGTIGSRSRNGCSTRRRTRRGFATLRKLNWALCPWHRL